MSPFCCDENILHSRHSAQCNPRSVKRSVSAGSNLGGPPQEFSLGKAVRPSHLRRGYDCVSYYPHFKDRFLNFLEGSTYHLERRTTPGISQGCRSHLGTDGRQGDGMGKMEVKQPHKFPHFTATDLVKFSENEPEISQGHFAPNQKKISEMVFRVIDNFCTCVTVSFAS